MLTAKTIGRYVANDGKHCAYCGSYDCDTTSDESWDDGEFLVGMHCHRCDKQWTEVYKLVGIREEGE